MQARTLLGLFLVALTLFFLYHVVYSLGHPSAAHPLILSNAELGVNTQASLWEQIKHAISIQPFNLVATILFILAIIHTLFANSITALYERLHKRNLKKSRTESFWLQILHFFGEVEVIFGLWIIPLLIAMTLFYDWDTSIQYLSQRNYTEPLFVFVIMTVASTEPVLQVANSFLRFIASLAGESVTAWWLTILTIGPLAGSFITEPAAMTICALLLLKQFYEYKPSVKLRYATLALLFVNISVGGVFTNFAAPPVIMISHTWDWSTGHMFSHFGYKALLGIVLSNLLYYLYFRKEFVALQEIKEQTPVSQETTEKMPFWIVFINLVTMAWVVIHSHYPVIFFGAFLLFLGFCKATDQKIALKPPFFVGFFLASLVIHGNLQGWWVSPVLNSTSPEALMGLSTVLTAFMDNAAITYLASLMPNISESMKYFVVAGAVTGGGLTVIANAPNLIGQTVLSPKFPHGVFPLNLFLAALLPTLIVGACFFFLSAFNL